MASVTIISENQTGSPITLKDLGSIVVPASGSATLTEDNTINELQTSVDLRDAVNNDQILLRVNGTLGTKQESLNVLTEIVQIATNQEVVALTNGSDAKDLHDHSDTIHVDEAGEISAITAKTNPSPDDFLVIESAGDGNAKRSITLGDLPSSRGGVSLTLLYKFNDATSASDPGSKEFKLNNSTPANVTAIYINDTTKNDFDAGNIYSSMQKGDRLYIQAVEDSSDYILATLTADPTDNGGWWTFNVNVDDNGNLFEDGKECAILVLTTAGDGLVRSRIQTVKTASVQNLNVAVGAAVSITFNANEFIDSDYTHTSGSSDITIQTTGTYKISYNVNINGATGRAVLNCAVYVNGTQKQATVTKSYPRNSSNNETGVCLSPYEISLTANDVITVRGYNTGDSTTLNTILNQCWVRIERVS